MLSSPSGVVGSHEPLKAKDISAVGRATGCDRHAIRFLQDVKNTARCAVLVRAAPMTAALHGYSFRRRSDPLVLVARLTAAIDSLF